MKLGVNIDHVATLRQQRLGTFPDPLQAALVAQSRGADSIVAHLREDRRHIQDRDVRQLKARLKIPLSLEMAATEDMVSIAQRLRPARVCLVPEKRRELTTEGGLNVVAQRAQMKRMIAQLQLKHIEVSLFLDPDASQIRCAAELGADTVELHTGRYASPSRDQQRRELGRLERASAAIRERGMHLHAGHGLDYQNVRAVARIPGMEELNIGFSIVSEAIFTGLGPAVARMKQLIR